MEIIDIRLEHIYESCEKIANDLMSIETLAERGSEELDFHYLHISVIRNAFMSAYCSGMVWQMANADKYEDGLEASVIRNDLMIHGFSFAWNNYNNEDQFVIFDAEGYAQASAELDGYETKEVLERRLIKSFYNSKEGKDIINELRRNAT